MATASPWHRPFTSAAASSLQSSTIFPLHHTKRFLLIPSSSSSSSSLCCCSLNNNDNNNDNGRKRLGRKSVQLIDVDVGDVDSPLNLNNAGYHAETNTFKPLFGKRRIFFASKKVRGIILLNLITIIYASNIPIVKEVEAIIDPEAFMVVRFVLAAIPFLPFVFRARDDSDTRKAGLELGFWVSLGYILQALGLLTSDAGRASFLCMFTVIVVPLIDGMLGSNIPVYIWFGAISSLVGVALLESSGSPPCIGDLLNFLSAVSFGIHMLRTEQITRSTKRENVLPLLGYEVCVVAFLSTLWYFTEGWFAGDIHASNPFSWTMGTVLDWISVFPWIPALYTGIFSTGLCLWVEMTAMRDVSATETSIIYGLEPVWGAGFAWFLLGERWGLSGWIGAALILGGSLTVQIMGARSDSDSDDTGRLILDKKSKISSNDPSVIVKSGSKQR